MQKVLKEETYFQNFQIISNKNSLNQRIISRKQGAQD